MIIFAVQFFLLKREIETVRFQKWVVVISVILFGIKITAWFFTNSVAILTDALESIVNIIASFIGLYSLILSAKPKDADHPYGHGKIEFVSAGIEGLLITCAGIFIIYKAVANLFNPVALTQLNFGLLLIIITALINYILGYLCEKKGEKFNSLALIASGKHLKSDTYTTMGIVAGLLVFLFTNITWMDSAVAILFALVIIYTGTKILRTSLAGIMDESDDKLIQELIDVLNKQRRINWIDLHNVRIIKYGPTLHIDCHLTVPWYFNVAEAHHEIDLFYALVTTHFGDKVEIFVHSDACQPFSCAICHKAECKVRQHPFVKTVHWDLNNIKQNNKHDVNS